MMSMVWGDKSIALDKGMLLLGHTGSNLLVWLKTAPDQEYLFPKHTVRRNSDTLGCSCLASFSQHYHHLTQMVRKSFVQQYKMLPAHSQPSPPRLPLAVAPRFSYPCHTREVISTGANSSPLTCRWRPGQSLSRDLPCPLPPPYSPWCCHSPSKHNHNHIQPAF